MKSIETMMNFWNIIKSIKFKYLLNQEINVIETLHLITTTTKIKDDLYILLPFQLS